MMPEWIIFKVRIKDLNKNKTQSVILCLKYSKIKFQSQNI